MAGAVRRIAVTGLQNISRSHRASLSSSQSPLSVSSDLLSWNSNRIFFFGYRNASSSTRSHPEADFGPGEEGSARQPTERTKPFVVHGTTAPIDVSNLERVEKSVNRVTLMGRVGSDPQLRGTEQNPILLFSLATHENYRSEEGALKQKTMWHRVGIFKGGLRESVFKWLKKGQRLYVSGAISYGNVKDQETNTVRVVTTILADEVIVLGGPSVYSSPTAPTADSAA